MSDKFTIDAVTWKAAQQELTQLRTVVFLQEQNISEEDEWDDKDENATHFLIRNTEGMAIGCARVLIEKPSTYHLRNENNVLHIGRVAILKKYRQQGIGSTLIKTILAWCFEHHEADIEIYLHAQTARLTFYTKLGFVIQGEVFIDAGIPHIEMWYKPN